MEEGTKRETVADLCVLMWLFVGSLLFSIQEEEKKDCIDNLIGRRGELVVVEAA